MLAAQHPGWKSVGVYLFFPHVWNWSNIDTIRTSCNGAGLSIRIGHWITLGLCSSLLEVVISLSSRSVKYSILFVNWSKMILIASSYIFLLRFARRFLISIVFLFVFSKSSQIFIDSFHTWIIVRAHHPLSLQPRSVERVFLPFLKSTLYLQSVKTQTYVVAASISGRKQNMDSSKQHCA